MQAPNEELQVSTEELEASEEELRALNEELKRVNHQLRTEIVELETRTSDLTNLLNSADIAILQLDRELCIRRFTPPTMALLELLPADIGRPISHVAQWAIGSNLVDDVRSVLDRQQAPDDEVVDEAGRCYLRHISPYRTVDDRIEGVVISFTDIARLKLAEQSLLESEQQARRQLNELDALYRTAPVGLALYDTNLRYLRINHVLAEINGVAVEAHIGRSVREILPDLADTIEPVLQRVVRSGKPVVDLEMAGIIAAKPGQVRHWITDFYPLKDVSGSVAIGAVVREITDRKLAEQALQESEDRFRQFADNSRDVLWIVDAASAKIEYLSPAFEKLWGEPCDVLMADGERWRELLHPEDRERAIAAMQRVRGGESAVTEYRIVRPNDGETRWVRDSAFPIRDAQGTLHRIAGLAEDITERRRSDEERELLTRELSHRVKNVLAVVQSLATQTDSPEGSVRSYREAFIGRLQSMARAHSLLLDTEWRGADLRTVVSQTVAPYQSDGADVVAISGGFVSVSPKQWLGLGLVLHELSTNAAKYGALSVRDGRLTVSWSVEQGKEERGREVWLHWQEREGPAVEAPERQGFGTRLIERVCTYELDGDVRLDYDPEGFSCHITFLVK